MARIKKSPSKVVAAPGKAPLAPIATLGGGLPPLAAPTALPMTQPSIKSSDVKKPVVDTTNHYHYPDGVVYKLDANGNRIEIDGDNSAYKKNGERLSPIIGGSPLSGFVYDNTGHGYDITSGVPIDKLASLKSLFKNNNIRPFMAADSSSFLANMYNVETIKAYNDSTYDISTIELIDWSKRTNKAIELEDLDFIFLKNLGVYTNNRLIIARRFPFGIYDDLTNTATKATKPISKLISWVKDGEDFIKIDFNEKWEPSDASFIEILNGIGKDLTTNISKADNPTEWGSAMAAGGGLVPLAGFTEVFQYNVLNQLSGGKLSTVDFTTLPQGNPNLIRESKRRSVPRDGKDTFSGVIGAFNVSMKVEYEQKYVFGIDPAFAYYSIIANALTFGTSVSSFNFTGNLGNKLKKFVDKISSGNAASLISAIVDFVSAVVGALQNMASQLMHAVKSIVKGEISLTDVGTQILNAIAKGISSIINKYKVKIIGVINSLTGSPSGPWHITIGNPKHPIFSSGDMIADKVSLTLGNTLSFNDLPANIIIDVDFKSARNLGAQEIFQKLNCGKERTYAVVKGYENGADYLTRNNADIATAVNKKVSEMTEANKARQQKDEKDANTKTDELKPILDSIRSKAKSLKIEFKENIKSIDEAKAVDEWIKNNYDTKQTPNLADKISYIIVGDSSVKSSAQAAYYFRQK